MNSDAESSYHETAHTYSIPIYKMGIKISSWVPNCIIKVLVMKYRIAIGIILYYVRSMGGF